MIGKLGRAATRNALIAAAMFVTATQSLAQAPSDAQRSAIRSSCRSDYQAHCSSVSPGGAEALQCLQKNMSSLSAACQSAVRAVEPPAAPKAEAAPAAPKPQSSPAAPPAPAAAAPPPAAPAAPKPAAAAAPKQPSSADATAIRIACRSDYPNVCAGVPTGGAPALQCLQKNRAKLSPGCARAVSAAGGGAAAAAPATAAPAAARAPTAIVLRPLRPREEIFIVRSACGGDIGRLCAGVPAGGGRIAQCLGANAASLSPACKQVLAPFAAR